MSFKGAFQPKPLPAYPKFSEARGPLAWSQHPPPSVFAGPSSPEAGYLPPGLKSFGEEGQWPATPLLAPTSPSHLSIPVKILALLIPVPRLVSVWSEHSQHCYLLFESVTLNQAVSQHNYILPWHHDIPSLLLVASFCFVYSK